MSGASKTVTLRVRTAALDDVHRDLARLHRDHRPGTRAGDVIVIRVDDKVARAVARGPLTKRQAGDEIVLDLRLRDLLGVQPNERRQFQISKGNTLDALKWAWHATDAMTRMMARLAVLSVALGAVGMFLGFISLFT